MTIRKTVTLVEEINREYGAPASPPLRRVAIAAVFENPLAGKATGADLKPLNIRSNSGLLSPRRHWRHLARVQRSYAPPPRRRSSASEATSNMALRCFIRDSA